MNGNQAPASKIIEPFDPEKHDRTAFSCGVDQVDNFFKKTANKLSKADNLRIWVLKEPSSTLIGFYALNAHTVDYNELPIKFAKTRPGHGSIPAAYISMIGVDIRFQGKGYGGDLLIDALKRVLGASEALGVAVILLDVLDCGDADQVRRRAELYKGYGFTPLASNPLKLFLPVATVRVLFQTEAAGR